MDRRRDNASRPPLVGLGLLLASLVLQAQPGQAAGGPLSVRDEAAFKAQRECGRDCMVFNGSIDLIGKFGCAWPYQNDCFCRADLGVAATKHFSSCGTARCTVGPSDGDISTMISIYNSYCLSNGYEVTKVQAQQAAPTGASGTFFVSTQPQGHGQRHDERMTDARIHRLLRLEDHGIDWLAAGH